MGVLGSILATPGSGNIRARLPGPNSRLPILSWRVYPRVGFDCSETEQSRRSILWGLWKCNTYIQPKSSFKLPSPIYIHITPTLIYPLLISKTMSSDIRKIFLQKKMKETTYHAFYIKTENHPTWRAKIFVLYSVNRSFDFFHICFRKHSNGKFIAQLISWVKSVQWTKTL